MAVRTSANTAANARSLSHSGFEWHTMADPRVRWEAKLRTGLLAMIAQPFLLRPEHQFLLCLFRLAVCHNITQNFHIAQDLRPRPVRHKAPNSDQFDFAH